MWTILQQLQVDAKRASRFQIFKSLDFSGFLSGFVGGMGRNEGGDDRGQADAAQAALMQG